MSTSPLPYSLRLAKADELALAIAIDDAAALLFARLRIVFDFPEQHPFVVAEYARWRRDVPWNKPFYEQRGFRAASELQCNSELRALLAEQREFLPAPEQRIAMMRTLA